MARRERGRALRGPAQERNAVQRSARPCGPLCRSETPTGRNPHDRVLLHTPPVLKKVWHSRWRGAASSALVSRSRAMPVGDRRSAVAFHLRGGRYAGFVALRAAMPASSPGRGLKTGGPFPPRHPADRRSAVPALREMLPCEVAGAGVGDQDVVLDADPAVGSQGVDRLPVDGVALRLWPVAPPGEEHLDEIDTGLHGQDVTRLEGPGAAEHGVRLRGRGPAAVGVGEVASHVVHLDAQEVAEAMREERLAETARDGGLPATG